jgi:hypothetical protein
MRSKIRLAASMVLLAILLASNSFSPVAGAAETLPPDLSDAAYWKLISDFSEPDGYFQLEIVTSNEMTYQYSLPELMKIAKTGGAYLGVGPEQNFTYIAAMQPKIAFIVDIRRDMMLEHLMYKAVFEMSADRAEFVSNLFSRKRPANLAPDTSVEAMFRAFVSVPPDRMLAEENLKTIMSRLNTIHKFPISTEDENKIRSIYLTFFEEGVATFRSSFGSPGYATLMMRTDDAGKNWSYLASKENYDRVRAMHQKNLIVPLVGDFAGPKTIQSVGQYVRDHDALVNVFYVSNVEDYISDRWSTWSKNVASLPTDKSSVLMRWRIGGWTSVDSISGFVSAQRK